MRRSTICALPPPIGATSPPTCSAACGGSRPASRSACWTHGMAEADLPRTGAVRRSLPHDSAVAHVAGRAQYIDDMPELPGLLHLAFGLAPDGHARVDRLDLSAVRAAPDVIAVFT